MKVRRFVHRSGFSQCDFVEWRSDSGPQLTMVQNEKRLPTGAEIGDAEEMVRKGHWVEIMDVSQRVCRAQPATAEALGQAVRREVFGALHKAMRDAAAALDQKATACSGEGARWMHVASGVLGEVAGDMAWLLGKASQ